MRATATQVRQRDVRPCPFPALPPEELFRRFEADETEFREQYWFMRWGEIVDNVSSYAYLDDDRRASHLLPEDRGKAYNARIPMADFLATVNEAAILLDSGLTA